MVFLNCEYPKTIKIKSTHFMCSFNHHKLKLPRPGSSGYIPRIDRAQKRVHNSRRHLPPYERSNLIGHRAHLTLKKRKYERLIRELDCTLHPEYCYYSHNTRLSQITKYGSCRCSEYLDTSSDED